MSDSYIQWCNENEGRSYPLTEDTTQLDDRGQSLPTDILADMCIMVPSEYAAAYCTTVRVSSSLLSVSVGCAAAPLLVCTVARSDYTPYTAVPMTPIVDDVSGWVVFGGHRYIVPELYQFSTVAQSQLEARAVRVVDKIPVQGFLRLNGDPSKMLEDLVTVRGGTGLAVLKHETESNTLVIELDSAQKTRYLGPCENYASTEGCRVPPICRISGVEADEDGVLTLRFEGIP